MQWVSWRLHLGPGCGACGPGSVCWCAGRQEMQDLALRWRTSYPQLLGPTPDCARVNASEAGPVHLRQGLALAHRSSHGAVLRRAAACTEGPAAAGRGGGRRCEAACAQVHRALQSAEAFLGALGWQGAAVSSAPAEADPLLRFHRLCRAYLDYKATADEALVRPAACSRASLGREA